MENVNPENQIAITQIANVLIWLAGFHATIVLGYLGLATAKEIFNKGDP